MKPSQHDDTNNMSAANRPPTAKHEPNTLSLKAVGVCALVLVVLVVVSQLIVARLLHAYGGDGKSSAPVASFDPGSARNWNNPEEDLATLRKSEDRHLNEYAWMDREHGVVRIPIAEAMELIGEQHGERPAPGPAPPQDHSDRGSDDVHEREQ